MSDAPDAMTNMPWIRWLDLDTTMEDDGTLRVSLLRPKPEHFNHNGHVNAAVAYGVAEVAGAGAAVRGLGSLLASTYTVIETGSIAYRRPARDGLVARARVSPADVADAAGAVERGEPRSLPVEVELADASGTATGTCSFVVALRPR